MVNHASCVAALAACCLVYAAPTSQHGAVHRIFAGSTAENGGLHFGPQNVVAEVSDVIEFHFLFKNHTVVQSSFDSPCKPLAGGTGIFSGFNFPTQKGENGNAFSFKVESKDTIWYYCSQMNGNLCQKGMSGVINQDFANAEKTLARYKEAAKGATTTQP
ncbi:hypothetical protein B0J11DRAFT_104008 [Dendryphion nanum]|uniref:Extracellular serine-rich protein n=1 Tax=Dendryphion nanum TaxID=256645 RepID=A0A9P9DD40_9PLEO|nr:hypothetical protein B0J11DRAFT_104008 [Dendryphion nanum]